MLFSYSYFTFQARQMGTKELDEDGLLDLVRSLPGKKSKYQVEHEKQQAKVPLHLFSEIFAWYYISV